MTVKAPPLKEVGLDCTKRGNTVLIGFLFGVKSVVWCGMSKVIGTVVQNLKHGARQGACIDVMGVVCNKHSSTRHAMYV